MKHLKTLWLYFKKWVSTTNTVDISSNYDDFLNELGPVKRKFFLDVIEAKSYDEYLSLQI